MPRSKRRTTGKRSSAFATATRVPRSSFADTHDRRLAGVQALP